MSVSCTLQIQFRKYSFSPARSPPLSLSLYLACTALYCIQFAHSLAVQWGRVVETLAIIINFHFDRKSSLRSC